MQPQTDGLLTAEPEPIAAPPLDDEAATLRDDVRCILLECHRDRGLQALHGGASSDAIHQLADAVARRLAPRIGGRYVPKRGDSDARAKRDAAVWQAIRSGRNVQKIMRDFGISQRLYYNIKARMRKA